MYQAHGWVANSHVKDVCVKSFSEAMSPYILPYSLKAARNGLMNRLAETRQYVFSPSLSLFPRPFACVSYDEYVYDV